MHWSLYVLIGAVINVFVNYGYKTTAAKENLFLLGSGVMMVASVTLLTIALSEKGSIRLAALWTGWTPLVIVGMGIGSAVTLYFFVTALTKGPLSLVDPLWACIYALTSVVVGLTLLRESPSLIALCGIALYLVGAYLMSRG